VAQGSAHSSDVSSDCQGLREWVGPRHGLVVVGRLKLSGLLAYSSLGYRGRYLWGNLCHWRCGGALRRGLLGSC